MAAELPRDAGNTLPNMRTEMCAHHGMAKATANNQPELVDMNQSKSLSFRVKEAVITAYTILVMRQP